VARRGQDAEELARSLERDAGRGGGRSDRSRCRPRQARPGADNYLVLSLEEDGVALAQPRLVAAGDLKGGRAVSEVTDLYAGTAFPVG
jgi:hypothetical protein